MNNVLIIDNFLTKQECQEELIYATEAGFVEQHYGVMKAEARRRAVKDDGKKAKALWSKVTLPPLITFYNELRPDPFEDVTTWKAVGFNYRFRYYDYEPGQRFSEHFDIMFRFNDRVRTFLTFIVYLNDDFEGGETRFGTEFIKPQIGSAIVFPHELKHEGMQVTKGRKTILRNDVVYQESNPSA